MTSTRHLPISTETASLSGNTVCYAVRGPSKDRAAHWRNARLLLYVITAWMRG
jgi:hypothetical protein